MWLPQQGPGIIDFLGEGTGMPFLDLSNTHILHRSKHLDYAETLGKGRQEEGFTLGRNKHRVVLPACPHLCSALQTAEC